MKPLLLHLAIVAVMASAGWWLGRSKPSAAAPSLHAVVPPPPVLGASSKHPDDWRSRIAAVRAQPGAASEIAWIKWAFAIPDADIASAIAALNPLTDLHALRYLYARWVKIDPAAAWESFRQSKIPATSTHFLVSARGDTTSNFVYSSLRSDSRSLIAGRMATSWMKADPVAATAFLEKFKNPDSPEVQGIPLKNHDLKRLSEGAETAAGTSPFPSTDYQSQWAAAWAETEASSRPGELVKLVNTWLQRDPDSTCRWLASLPPEQRGSLDMSALAFRLKDASPSLAVPLLFGMLHGDGNDDSQLIEQAQRANDPRQNEYEFSPILNAVNSLQQWGQSDPPAAVAFLATMDDTDLRAVLTGQMAGALSHMDSATAVALLNDMPGDQSLAVPIFAREWARIDAEATWRWAGQIDDPEMRAAARETALLGLATSEPAHALRLARDSGDESLQQTTVNAVRTALQWNPNALNRLSQAFPELGGVAKR